MQVGELIDILSGFPYDQTVILSSDSEGNQYSPLDGAWSCHYKADSNYSGELVEPVLTPELAEQGYGPDDIYAGIDYRDAVVLYPTR
jgi:hypothetical protein